MGRLFKHRKTSAGLGAISEATRIATEALKGAEDIHGADSVEAANGALVLASIHYLNEDYEPAEPLFERYVDIVSKQLGQDAPEVVDGLSHLMNTCIGLGDFTGVAPITERISHLIKRRKETGGLGRDTDPLVEALQDLAVSCKDKGDEIGFKRGFVFALMALSWCVTSHKAHHPARLKIIPQLRELIMSFGIDKHAYAWFVRRSDQREHDFVGFLSVIDEEGVFSLKGFELEGFPELNLD